MITKNNDWVVRIGGMQQLQGLALGGETRHAAFKECLSKVKEDLVKYYFHPCVYILTHMETANPPRM